MRARAICTIAPLLAVYGVRFAIPTRPRALARWRTSTEPEDPIARAEPSGDHARGTEGAPGEA